MRYELADFEWAALKPMLPNKPRGVPRVNDRRVLNGIFWVLRSGAPWRDLPEAFGPYTTCYNRFVRWRRAGVWSRIMNALAAAHDTAVQMIDTSIVRVHQHGACITRNQRQSMGRSRGGLTSKIHALVDSNGLSVRLALSPGEAHDNRLADKLQHSGAIVKTIGDAVMAVFSRPTHAVSAALDILGEIERYNSEHGDPSIILKIGAHCGPSIAVTLNDNLDYFGQTVNVAARVQSLAEAGEICISEALYSAPGVGQILTGLKIVEFDAPLGEGEAEFAQGWIGSPVA